MNAAAWVIVAIVGLSALGVLVWLLASSSLVRVPTGRLGLKLSRGRATDITLPPGLHWVPALRRVQLVEYPSVELAYRAGADDALDTDLERSGPQLPVALGDRTSAVVRYTVRFSLDPEQLRMVHELYGPDGIFSVVRDVSQRAVSATLSDPDVGADDVYGASHVTCEAALTVALRSALAESGLLLRSFVLGDVDLGRTGEIIQATARARHEREFEEAEAQVRIERARNDAKLSEQVTTPTDSAWRYRQSELWREAARLSPWVPMGGPQQTSAVGHSANSSTASATKTSRTSRKTAATAAAAGEPPTDDREPEGAGGPDA